MPDAPPSQPPSQIAHVYSQQNNYQSVDRIAFSAIAVSAATKLPYILPTVLSFETSKTDGGDPGTFSLTFPMSPTYEGIPNPAPGYAKIAMPMDVIAIYALRVVSTDAVVSGAPTSVPQTAPSGVSWGVAGFIDALVAVGGGSTTSVSSTVPFGENIAQGVGAGSFASGTCVFIGMLDEARVKVEIGGQPQVHLLLNGHDLTKVFVTNDAAIPVVLAGVMGAAPYSPAGNMPVIQGPTGPALIYRALDYMVSRIGPNGQIIAPGFEQYAFPWRSFISLAQIDPNFVPAGATAQTPILPYRIQDGTAWANMTDLRSAPVNRLFVDEYANLIFDDAYHAWTNDDGSNASAFLISAAEVLDYDFYIDDTALVTMLSVWPSLLLQSAALEASIDLLKGKQMQQMLPSATATVAAKPVPLEDVADIQRYGVRYGQFTSFWDTDLAAVQNRFKYLLLNHDSICFCDVMVRGRSIYHVGMRVTVVLPAHRAEFTNAEWYVTSVSHSGSFGSTWTTRLQLRYPKGADGQIH